MGEMPKRHLEAATEEERAKQRRKLGSLKSLTVQPVTRARYKNARESFYAWLRTENLLLPHTPFRLDMVVSDYLEALWAQGKGRSEGSNLLAGLQDAQPHLKGKLPSSWRLMKTWVTHETPNRAPPLSLDVLHLLVGFALFKGQSLFALSLLLAFHGLLRTGELLSLQARDISVSKAKGPAVINLGLTKAGKRQGAAESVTLHGEDVCRRLHQWVSRVPGHTSLTGPPHLWRKQFSDYLKALHLDQFQYRPYSLRRGGAAYYFQTYGTFDKLLVLGRWQAASTARIYVNEGLSVLTSLKIPWTPYLYNLRSQYLRSLTQPLVKLVTTKHPSQKRGTRKGKGAKKGRHLDMIWPVGWRSPVSRVWPEQQWPSITKQSPLGFGRGVFVVILAWLLKLRLLMGGSSLFVNQRVLTFY